MMDGEFDPVYLPTIRDVVARIGIADVRAFGLTWEDCEHILAQLGYSALGNIVAGSEFCGTELYETALFFTRITPGSE